MAPVKDNLPFRAEYAQRINSFCKSKSCKEKRIEKGSLRLSTRSEARNFDGKQENWYHEECFFRKLKLPKSISQISNYNNLKVDDKEKIRRRIDAITASTSTSTTNKTRKRKCTTENRVVGTAVSVEMEEPDEKRMKTNRNIIAEQTKRFWFYRDALKRLKREEILTLLQKNGQYQVKEIEHRFDILADGMAFGALECCRKCNWGQLVVDSEGYRCIAREKWVKCNELTEDPLRKSFVVPEDLQQRYDFLGEYECKIQKRVFEKTLENVENVSLTSDLSIRSSTEGAIYNTLSKKATSNIDEIEIQNDTAVDPQSIKRWVAHQYRDANGIDYTAYMTRPDLQTGKNSYYKLQVLESNKGYYKKCYWLFKAWGRVGTTRGDCSHEEYLTSREAVDTFQKEFFTRTGNRFSNRNNFVKKPSKYMITDVSYKGPDSKKYLSNLDNPTQDLVRFIFNTESMTKVLFLYNLDLALMPLGKLSRDVIKKGFELLQKLENHIIEHGETIDQEITRYTNEFFANIPHNVGNNGLPSLNRINLIEEKKEMLRDLWFIELAYSLLNFIQSVGPLHKINLHYKGLNTDLELVKSTDSEFETLNLYFMNTQVHSEFKLSLVQFFKVERNGEDERFTPFKNFSNRQLLWHGTRTFFIPGILQEGLTRTPTQEVSRRGFMFGNGLYFADRVSKSAQYCKLSKEDKPETGILLLCEVALGNMRELIQSEYIEELPENINSVHGAGKIEPDPMETRIFKDGVKVPLGCGIRSRHEDSKLDYNEFVVYDERQIRIRYLARVQFTWKPQT